MNEIYIINYWKKQGVFAGPPKISSAILPLNHFLHHPPTISIKKVELWVKPRITLSYRKGK
jgi:hypothetical protein